MDNYEQFRTELLTNIYQLIGLDDYHKVEAMLDAVSTNYKIERANYELTTYESGVPEICKEYIVAKGIKGLSPLTLKNYMLQLNLFFNKVKVPINEISARHIRSYIFEYQMERKVQGNSLDKVRQMLSSFFQWAFQQGYIDNNPAATIDQIKFEQKPRTFLTQFELESIRHACKTKRESAMIEFMYSTGCRVSEMCGVKFSDINTDSKEVHLFGKWKKHRTSFINAKAEFAIRDYVDHERKGNSEYLFVATKQPFGKLERGDIEKIVRDIISRTNITKKVTPHVFRHTCATTAVNNGMSIENVQQLLGHENIATTMIYAHTNRDKVKSEHKNSVI